MALVFRETAQGKVIANFLGGGRVAGFSDLLTEIPQKGVEGGMENIDLEPIALDFLELGRHFPVPLTLN